MMIEFHAADRMFGLKALGIYAAGIQAAKTACGKVYVIALELQEAEANAEAVESWIAGRLDEMGLGEERDVEIATPFALTLRTACSVYLAQLTKLSEKQADLLVPIEDTNVTISHLQSLADRLGGQGELVGTVSHVTMQFGDGEPITVTEGQLARAAEKARRADGRASEHADS
jgi:hypothetical protein